jgi:hypothetical protein
MVAIPSAAVALTFDEETYSYSHDDENGDSETQYNSVVTYERNGDSLQGVASKTSCKENREVRRPTTVDHDLWNRSKEVFVERELEHFEPQRSALVRAKSELANENQRPDKRRAPVGFNAEIQ